MATTDERSPRIPYVADGDDPAFDEIVERVRAAGKPVPNMQRLLGHNPQIALGIEALTRAVRFESALPKQLLELALLRVTVLEGGRYPFAQHVRFARAEGITESQLRCVGSDPAADCFDPLEQLVLRVVDEMSASPQMSDETFALLAVALPPAQVLELVVAVSLYTAMSMIGNNLGVQVDEHVRADCDPYWPNP